MPLATNIHRRAGSSAYYARIAIPLELQPHFPRTPGGKLKKELWKSLDTKNAREARDLAPALIAHWKAEFAEMRRSLAAVVPTEGDLSSATWDHYRTELEHHDRERRRLPTSEQIATAVASAKSRLQSGDVPDPHDPLSLIHAAADAMVLSGQAALNRDFRTRRKAEIERHLASGETVLAHDAARDLIRHQNYAIEEGSPDWRNLCHRLLRADLEGLRRAEEQAGGDFTGRPRDPIVTPPHRKEAPPVAAPGESILDLLGAYEADNRARLSADTIRVNQQVVGMFAEFVGTTLPVSAIDKKQVFAWKTALRRYPIRATEVGAFKGMKFQQILTANEKLGRPTLSDKTVNRYLSAIGGFATWAKENGLISENPVLGTLIRKNADRSKVRPYSADQLTTIFRSPAFT